MRAWNQVTRVANKTCENCSEKYDGTRTSKWCPVCRKEKIREGKRNSIKRRKERNAKIN